MAWLVSCTRAAVLTPILSTQVMGPLNEFSAAFSNSFAQPLKDILPRTYSEGYGGSPRAFFNMILTDPEALAQECGARPIGAEDGTACAYAAVSVPLVGFDSCCYG